MGRFDFTHFIRIDCLRVTPQTHTFSESADRDLSIAHIRLGRKLLCSDVLIERRGHPCQIIEDLMHIYEVNVTRSNAAFRAIFPGTPSFSSIGCAQSADLDLRFSKIKRFVGQIGGNRCENSSQVRTAP